MEINSDLINKNNETLMLLNTNCLKRRMKREIENLYKTFNNVFVSLDSNPCGKIKITILETIQGKKHTYEFIINEHYPFKSPKIYYQHKPYENYLKIEYTKPFLNIFRKISKKECLCCTSYNCSSNWTPAITIEKIISEIYYVREIKRKVIHKFLADKIKMQYLIDDIDLDSWLF